MKHPLTLFLLLLITCSIAFARTATSYADTSTTVLTHKHSKQYFLDNYGKNDSTRALINYFFKKRKSALYETILPPIVGGVSVLLLHTLMKGNLHAMHLPVLISLVVVVYAVPVYSIAGQIKWLVFSRKRLLTILENYNSGIPIPKGLTHRKMFEAELASSADFLY